MTYVELTPKAVDLILQEHKRFFNTQVTKPLAFRLKQLNALKSGIKKWEKEITAALYQDLGKPENEAYLSEIGNVYHSISLTQKNLKKWARPEKAPTPFFLMPAKSYIVSEPYGTVLIVGPYNYPFGLVMEPLIGALMAGNTAVLKPSEMTPNVTRVINQLIGDTFDRHYVRCVEGTVETSTSLINAKFDYIFFTGSVPVGKIVMEAAAKNLIPVTLELGGKSPVIVEQSAHIKEAARRIIWGKTMNAGQTCVAPDYVVVHQAVKDELVREMKAALREFFGENIEKSQSFGRIINHRHFQRIQALIEADREGIVFGGHTHEKTNYIEPTLIEISSWGAATMGEEIFGPVLPILTYSDLNEAIQDIKQRPKPLALYVFTRNHRFASRVLGEISSGNVTINDTISHIANPFLPFGGVGEAGLGAYHGQNSFVTFSHRKGILQRPASIKFRVQDPPFSESKLKAMKKLLK